MQGIFDKQVNQLADLITIINGELTKNDRKKLITLCTIDVHARDVVQRLIDERVENQSCFQWQSQLRYYQNEKTKEAQVNICDAEIKYTYEYIGNCGCLCITPLTDRCYITLTQAQRLVLGGAPAGPAGMLHPAQAVPGQSRLTPVVDMYILLKLRKAPADMQKMMRKRACITHQQQHLGAGHAYSC